MHVSIPFIASYVRTLANRNAECTMTLLRNFDSTVFKDDT